MKSKNLIKKRNLANQLFQAKYNYPHFIPISTKDENLARNIKLAKVVLTLEWNNSNINVNFLISLIIFALGDKV